MGTQVGAVEVRGHTGGCGLCFPKPKAQAAKKKQKKKKGGKW